MQMLSSTAGSTMRKSSIRCGKRSWRAQRMILCDLFPTVSTGRRVVGNLVQFSMPLKVRTGLGDLKRFTDSIRLLDSFMLNLLFSTDDRFILKQMPRLEVQSFLDFAPHYFTYITGAVHLKVSFDHLNTQFKQHLTYLVPTN